MSKIKWGAVVVDGRGKLGGHVFSKTKSGAIMRTKVTPVNPQTSFQSAVRGRLGALSQGWGNLSEGQRATWITRAAETSKTNIFGDQYFPSGKNMYVGINSNLQNVGKASVVVAPAPQILPVIESFSVTYDLSDIGEVSINFSAIPTDCKIVIEATQPFSAGRYNFDGSYRQIGVFTSTTINPSIGFNDLYVAKFGDPFAGQKIGFRVYLIGEKGGNASPRVTASTIVIES